MIIRLCSKLVSTPQIPLTILLFVITTLAITTWQLNKNSSLGGLKIIPESSKEYMHIPKKRPDTEITYNAESLPSWDFTRLINMSGFTFYLENTVCGGKEPVDLLIAIHSAPKNVLRRKSIRESWGQKRNGIKLLFFFGAVQDQKVQDALDAEDRIYHDLIQGNFLDTYKNLTYKHVMIFKYAVYYCPLVKFILKTDDDLLVNIEHVLDYLKTNISGKNQSKDLILCSIMDGSPTIREKSKWFVPFEENPHRFYPVYCSGFAVIYSYDVAFRLYREAQRGEYFWVDDAFVSGTLAKRINIKHTSIPKNSLMSYQTMNEILDGNWSNYNPNFWYGPVNLGVEGVTKLWKAVQAYKNLNEEGKKHHRVKRFLLFNEFYNTPRYLKSYMKATRPPRNKATEKEIYNSTEPVWNSSIEEFEDPDVIYRRKLGNQTNSWNQIVKEGLNVRLNTGWHKNTRRSTTTPRSKGKTRN